MTKTLLIDSVRIIKKSIVIYISIIIFTMLCVALYIGLEWGTESITKSLDDAMVTGNLYDIRILYDHGLSENDIKIISEINEIDEITVTRLGYGIFINNGNQRIQARIQEISDSMNLPMNPEGNLPKNSNEAAVSKNWANDNNIKIGDTISFLSDNSMFSTLTENELIVTAFMDTVEYNQLNTPGYGVSELNNLPVGCILYVSKEAFNPLIYQDGNQILIKCNRLRAFSSFEDEYITEKEKIKSTISEVLTKNGLSGFMMTDRTCLPPNILSLATANSLRNAKSILVSVFLIIGLLICYASIIRMVNDHSYLIGTKMAMGINPRAIRFQYYLYTESAIIIGCIIGSVLGRFIANVVLNVLSKSYALPFICKAYPVPLIGISLFEMAAALLVTFLGLYFTFKKKAVELLNKKTTLYFKKHFYERFNIWKKLSLFVRAVINNFVNDKKRVLETLIGIVGSTTLIMISLTMYYDADKSYFIQYSDYYKFDSYIFYDGTEDASEKIASVLEERNIPYSNVMHTRKYITKPDGLTMNTYMVVFDDVESFRNLVNIDPDDDVNGTPYKGLWVSFGYRNHFGQENANSIRFLASNGYLEVPTEGFFKYYLDYFQFFLDRETYETYWKEDVVNNAFMISTSGINRDELLDTLIEIPGYHMFNDYYKQTSKNFKTYQDIVNVLVAVYLILAILLSLMVSLSVLSMFINEKKKELIVMMINAYSAKKVKQYIFLDTAFITIFGILLGLILGGFMGIESVMAFENDVLVFVHEVPVSVILISATSVAFIMIILSLIVQRRIGKFKLSEINDVV